MVNGEIGSGPSFSLSAWLFACTQAFRNGQNDQNEVAVERSIPVEFAAYQLDTQGHPMTVSSHFLGYVEYF